MNKLGYLLKLAASASLFLIIVSPSFAAKPLPNYSALTSNITSNKALVQTALDKAQADTLAFSCDSENPRTLLLQFNTNMKLVKGALKTYRTAINKLIVAIRTIPAISPTPSPTNNVTI